MPHSYIISGARTPIGAFQGAFTSLSATDLGGIAVREAIQRSSLSDEQIDEVIMGHVIQAGAGQAPARQAALKGGLPATIPAVTINKVCGSGLKAVMMASALVAGSAAKYISPVLRPLVKTRVSHVWMIR